jgi:hypothetical protein
MGKLYTGMWLPLPWDLKNHIVAKYKITRTGASHVITKNGKSEVASDGYTENDLSKIDTAFLQIVLNTEEKDFFVLWSKFLAKMEKEIAPKKVAPAKVEEKPNQVSVNITVNKNGEVIAETTKVERATENKNATETKESAEVESTSK